MQVRSSVLQIIVDPTQAVAKSRVTAWRLIGMRLRLLALWRGITGGHDESLILMAVVAITGERVAAQDLNSEFQDMATPVPRKMLGRCNISSIAEATGLNRETARRAIRRLMDQGILERGPDRSIHFTEGRMQGANAYRISQTQLDEFARTANALLRDGVLKLHP